MHGLALSNLESFVDNLRRALREFHRQRRAERTRRGGHPTGTEELATAFRLVEFHEGSAIMTLIPDVEDAEETAPPIGKVEPLAIENLHALLDAVEVDDQVVDPAVTDAIESARRALGHDGTIAVKLNGRPKPRRVVIDRERVESLERRVERRPPQRLRISGRLHMIDLEPDRVGIRAANGVDWTCSYPHELEEKVRALVGKNVWARGVGSELGGAKGSLTIAEIDAVGEYEQTRLFTFERVPLDDLMAEQGIRGPQGTISIVPPEVTDEEFERFLEATLDE
ncbi:MAG TPA: hypothetical protein VF101_20260 [Gaiellaceae bacterium]